MNIIENTEWEVLTPAGWRDFSGIKKTTVPVHSKIELSDKSIITCSPTHKIKLLSGLFVDVMDLVPGEYITSTKYVVSNILVSDALDVYDLHGVDGEEYFTDNFISHNCAFIDAADLIWTSAQATLSTGGKAVLLSTPNGVGNFFHKMWQNATTKQNNFNPILLDWRVHPDRDDEWRARQTEILGEAQAAQEHDASFIFSGNTVINPEIIEFYRKTHLKDPVSKQGFDGNFWVWEYPHTAKTYIVAADVARGDGEDYSTIQVIDVERSLQVAEYKGKLSTKEFGNLMVAVATEYNDALLIPDNSSIGWAAIQQVIDRGYKNLFYMSADMQYVDVEHQITNRSFVSEKNMKPGFTVTTRTRPLIIAKIDEYLRENAITIHSSRLIAELETFIWKNSKAEAMQGYNDDLVFSLGIALWIRDTALRLRQQGLELTKTALNLTSTSAMPFSSNQNNTYDTYKMSVGENYEDIKWLLG
jgi:hypothetical protein